MDVLTIQQRGSNIAALFHVQSLGNFATAAHRYSNPFAKRMAHGLFIVVSKL
jgi:hypothetical protein